MKTIAVTVDEPTLQALEALTRQTGRPRSRSAVVREAVCDLAERRRSEAQDTTEREILHRNRKRLALEARALVRQQAKP